MLNGILVIAIFLIFVVLMLMQKISTFNALLLMSILIPLVCGVPIVGTDSILSIISDGSTRMASSITALVFGAWLGQLMNETGITRDMIRRATELGGDRPIVLSIAVSFVVALVFTALNGLGATIMVGTLVLPILTAVGIKPVVAGTMFLFARAVGYNFNLYVWSLFTDVTGMELADIRNFGIIVTAITAVLFIVFLVVEMKIRKTSVAWCPPQEAGPEALSEKKIPLIALLTPIIPFPLVIIFEWPIIPALIVGCAFALVTTTPLRSCLSVGTKTMHEAVKSAAPAIVLMIVIGMIIAAVGNELVANSILTIISPIMPKSVLPYVIFFSLLAPLALYRGPLNMFGLGSGVIGIFVAAGQLPAAAIMAAFFAAQVIQQAGDPTNSQNVWTADFVNVEVNKLTTRSLPYLWISAVLCIIAGAIMYF